MFSVRSKRSLMQAAVAVPVAALLLAGCGGDDEAEPAATSTSQAPAASPSTADATEATPEAGASETPMNPEQLTEEMYKQLELAAEQAGPKQLGALTCETMRGFNMTADQAGADKAAISDALGEMMDSLVEGASAGGEKVQDADLDTTTEKECPEIRDETLKISGAKSLATVAD